MSVLKAEIGTAVPLQRAPDPLGCPTTVESLQRSCFSEMVVTPVNEVNASACRIQLESSRTGAAGLQVAPPGHGLLVSLHGVFGGAGAAQNRALPMLSVELLRQM